MAPSRSLPVSLTFASLLVAVFLALLTPSNVSAQATHSGVFEIPLATGGRSIYIAPAGSPTKSVLVTVCLTALTPGFVLVSTPTSGLGRVDALSCATFAAEDVTMIGVTSPNSGASGTYTVSTNLK